MPKKATKRKAAKASGKKSVSRPAKKKTKIKTTRSTPTTKKKAASKKTPAVKSKKTGASKAYAKPEPMVASRLLRNAPHSIQHKKKPEILASRHKARSAWFRDRAAWPMREASIRTLVHERRRINQTLPEEPGSAQWASVGPTNIGGRMTCIVCDPVNPERVIAGAAGGGLWSSDDAGMTWRSLWHKQDSLNVGTLALDPNNPQIVYCGTGEANLSADSYPGVGVLRSLDGGETWHRLATPECENLPVRIGTIAVDPFDSNHIALGRCWSLLLRARGSSRRPLCVSQRWPGLDTLELYCPGKLLVSQHRFPSAKTGDDIRHLHRRRRTQRNLADRRRWRNVDTADPRAAKFRQF